MWGAMHVAATIAMAMLHGQAEMVTFLLVMEFNFTRVIAGHAVIPTIIVKHGSFLLYFVSGMLFHSINRAIHQYHCHLCILLFYLSFISSSSFLPLFPSFLPFSSSRLLRPQTRKNYLFRPSEGYFASPWW